jgi:hypothetical protein
MSNYVNPKSFCDGTINFTIDEFGLWKEPAAIYCQLLRAHFGDSLVLTGEGNPSMTFVVQKFSSGRSSPAYEMKQSDKLKQDIHFLTVSMQKALNARTEEEIRQALKAALTALACSIDFNADSPTTPTMV